MDRARAPLLALLASLGLLALACTRTESEQPSSTSSASPSAPQDTSPPLNDTRPPSEPSWTEPTRSHLLLHQHLPEQDSAKLLPMTLSTDPPAPGLARTHAASPLPNWPGHFTSELSHDGGNQYVIVQGAPEAWQLEAWPFALTSDPTARVELGEVLPAAVTLIGADVLLGQANTIAWIDLAADPPTRVELTRRDELFGKAYDLFVRSGSWLIAIDDQVSPIWADGFRLGLGQPERIQDLELPSAINGSYYAGQLVASGPTDGVLYLLLHYGIMDGHGHDLTALTLRAGKLSVSSEVLINSSAGIDPPVLEEHVDRRTDKPTKLAAGVDYSEWTQIAYALAGGQPRLLISAGERGLLELPIDFGPTTKANVIELGGSVLDVIALGERTFTLVSSEQVGGELVELSLQPTGAKLERRTPLPEVYQRFVR
jgi:hypothetical protein